MQVYAQRGEASNGVALLGVAMRGNPSGRNSPESFMNEEQTKTETGKVRSLPLWKSFAEQLIAEGIEHGKEYRAEVFEDGLGCKRDSIEYGFAVSEVRKILEDLGYYLSGRGMNGKAFVIIEPEGHCDVAGSRERQAMVLLLRATKLLSTTRRELMSSEDVRKLDSVLARLQIKSALISRDVRIVKKSLPESKKAA